LSLFLLIAIDNWSVWASLILALASILAFAILRAHEIANIKWLIMPMVILTLAILLFFIRTPINFNLPAEISLSSRASAQITQKTLQEAPLLGSGPGTFIFDYTKFKPQGINGTPLWNVKFDRSTSRILTLIATTGLLGFFSWLFLIIFLAIKSFANLVKEKPGTRWIYNLGFFSAWLLLLIAKFFYSSNLTLEFLFWFTTAMIAIFTFKNFTEIRLETSPRTSLLLSFLLTLGIIFSISTFYLLGQRFVADFKFQQAVLADQRGEKPEKITDYLNQATALNRFDDVYFMNLTQSLLAEINQKLQEEPNEQTGREIQNLFTAAVDAGKRATELNPENSSNWSVLASVYQTFIPFQISGADEWAINSYNQAIELESDNPFFHTELGKVYASVADLRNQKLAGATDELKTTLQDEIKDNLAKAEEQFNKAIDLKSDYAPAHFELALVYNRQGKTKEAISKLEMMKDNLPNDIGVAFQLGLLYNQNKEQDKAIAELERAVKIAPNFANARWYLATIYEEQGKKDLAIAQLEEILKTNPDNETVKKKLEELKNPAAAESAPLPEPIE
jgi:tetratricopeptide (TPR) repeat protein